MRSNLSSFAAFWPVFARKSGFQYNTWYEIVILTRRCEFVVAFDFAYIFRA